MASLVVMHAQGWKFSVLSRQKLRDYGDWHLLEIPVVSDFEEN